jgi:His/Glu/Gln/Arg/opine family amino acid ABC transporter permease subunit
MSGYFSDLRDWYPLFLQGAVTTVGVSIATMVLGTALGLLLALLRLLPCKGLLRIVPWVIRAYVDLFRGLPVIVTLFIIYFGLPTVGLEISSNAIIAGTVGLTLTLSAYLTEVFRAAIAAVDPGQMEAARAMGMSLPAAYRRIVVPQALLVAVPTLGGYFIGLLKDSSLLGFISVSELMRSAVMLVSESFKPFEIYMTVGAIYLALSLLSSWLVSLLEQRLRPLEKAFTGREQPIFEPQVSL